MDKGSEFDPNSEYSPAGPKKDTKVPKCIVYMSRSPKISAHDPKPKNSLEGPKRAKTPQMELNKKQKRGLLLQSLQSDDHFLLLLDNCFERIIKTDSFCILFKQTNNFERQAYHWSSSKRNSIKKYRPGNISLQ